MYYFDCIDFTISIMLNNSRQILYISRPYNLKTVRFVLKNVTNFANRRSKTADYVALDRQFEESRHMLGPTMGRDRLSNSARAPSSHVHRDKCASGPPPRSYWPFAGSFGTWGRLIQVFLRRPSRADETRVPRVVERALTRWREGISSRGTALQRISTAQTERLGLFLPPPHPFSKEATRVRSGKRSAKRAGERSDRAREKERGETTERVYPLIGSHMSRDLISRYLRPYLPLGGPRYLSLPLSLFHLPHTRGVADNEMERNANRIAPASEIH